MLIISIWWNTPVLVVIVAYSNSGSLGKVRLKRVRKNVDKFVDKCTSRLEGGFDLVDKLTNVVVGGDVGGDFVASMHDTSMISSTK